MTVRVRFAPSPTGNLHIGGARTALFNWLFARKMKGTFMLRIEDTDELRSTAESVKAIFEGMKWMGLDWDEGAMPDGTDKGSFGPYFQAVRAHNGVYKKYSDQLIAEGKAYHCYCTPQELDAERKRADLEKRPYRYDGRCRRLTAEQKKELEAQGRRPVVRFHIPEEGTTEFHDLIRGDLKFENKLLYDLVIVKASGFPTYNFACVIDDHLMDISHVIRGDDHISNTPMQLNIYKALGWKHPEMAHLSMIHGQDGTKLSKRNGDVAVGDYAAKGLLPQVMRNYLALLGWSTSDSQQIFAKGELEEKFDIAGCQKNPAKFDLVKLSWMNGEYLRAMSPKELVEAAMPFIKAAHVAEGADPAFLEKVICLEQEKYKLLTEIPHLIEFFFTEKPVFDQKAVDKVFKKPEARRVLEGMAKVYEAIPSFTEAELEKAAREFAAANTLKAGQIFHPVRVAVSGRTEGPTLFRMLEYLGRGKVVARMRAAAPMCAEAAV